MEFSFFSVKENEMAGNLARMDERGMNMGYWWESQKERDL
jgi:hypothetical protein